MPMLSVLDILNRTAEFFGKRGVPQPRLDAELLLAHALGCKRLDLYLQHDRPLPENELEAIRPLVRRRAEREPLQYILGETEFYGLKLKCDPRALIPRPETEELVERVVARLREEEKASPAAILDLGTGSGALALALATAYPDARVTATDSSADALALARENAEADRLSDRIQFIHTSWLKGVKGPFDLVVSNPPYLADAELEEVEPELKAHEPREALVAGPHGREALEAILSGARGVLGRGGLLAMETGAGQHAELERAARAASASAFVGERDLSGHERYVFVHY